MRDNFFILKAVTEILRSLQYSRSIVKGFANFILYLNKNEKER
jgi:hypothetical protein